MLLKRGLEIGSENMIKLVAWMDYLGGGQWLNVIFLLFRCW